MATYEAGEEVKPGDLVRVGQDGWTRGMVFKAGALDEHEGEAVMDNRMLARLVWISVGVVLLALAQHPYFAEVRDMLLIAAGGTGAFGTSKRGVTLPAPK
jgi:hypothetical protein